MIRLKDFVLPSVVIQSPMANCTDLPFRLIAREKGMRFAFLEMVSAQALVRDNRKTRKLLTTAPGDNPVGAQLVGCDPEVMAEAAVMVEDMGFSLVDLNLGCPVPKIVSPGGGSALLREPEKVRRIFSAIMRRLKRIPLTVKMRIGFTDPSGEEACTIARIAEEEGLSAVAVHGRTRSQGYTGQADYRAIRKVKEAVSIPVIGNGDVHDGASALRLMREAGVDGVMIGRGALGNPWIYREVEASLEAGKPVVPVQVTFEDRKMTLLKHLELEAQHDPETAHLQMRRVACWYFRDVPFVSQFRKMINTAPSLEAVRSLIKGFRWRDPSEGETALPA